MLKSPKHTRLPAPHTRGAVDIKIMRSIIGFLGTWQHCCAACRRHKRCASPAVACFDVNLETIRETLENLAEWPRLDGPRQPDEANGPVGDLLD
jgi:hypothetical protein